MLDGLLDLADQLEEGGHHTKGDDTCPQLQGTPDEGDDITKTETRRDENT